MPPTPRSQALAPLFLRLSLGVTFLVAGMGKVLPEMPVSGASAALLANMGVFSKAAPKPADAPALPQTDTPPATTPDRPRPVPTEPLPPATQPQGRSGPLTMLALMAPAKPQTATVYTAEDFPDPVAVKPLYGLALLIHGVAHPAPDANGRTPMRLWPSFLAGGRWPVYIAWMVTIAEIAGGALLLIGLFARLAAFLTASCMVGAIWLTEVGVALQTGKTWLGFLPDYPPFAPPGSPDGSYSGLMLQFILLTSSIAVMLLGAGALSLDSLLFGRKAPRPAPARPSP